MTARYCAIAFAFSPAWSSDQRVAELGDEIVRRQTQRLAVVLDGLREMCRRGAAGGVVARCLDAERHVSGLVPNHGPAASLPRRTGTVADFCA